MLGRPASLEWALAVGHYLGLVNAVLLRNSTSPYGVRLKDGLLYKEFSWRKRRIKEIFARREPISQRREPLSFGNTNVATETSC